jgi:hypothetical protein
MKLNRTAEAFKGQILHPHLAELSFEEFLAFLVNQQWTWREGRCISAALSGQTQDQRLHPGCRLPRPQKIKESVILQLAYCDCSKIMKKLSRSKALFLDDLYHAPQERPEAARPSRGR